MTQKKESLELISARLALQILELLEPMRARQGKIAVLNAALCLADFEHSRREDIEDRVRKHLCITCGEPADDGELECRPCAIQTSYDATAPKS